MRYMYARLQAPGPAGKFSRSNNKLTHTDLLHAGVHAQPPWPNTRTFTQTG